MIFHKEYAVIGEDEVFETMKPGYDLARNARRWSEMKHEMNSWDRERKARRFMLGLVVFAALLFWAFLQWQ